MNREMTASIRRRPCSQLAPPPLEDDDLLAEILLRLPPQPSFLPRASAVSRRWRGLVSDPRFSRRFRIRHRRNPPLLGCFVSDGEHARFQPILDPPNRVPHGRFSFPIAACDRFRILGCRHGLVLIFHATRNQLLVWDPVTGGQHRLDIPPRFDTRFPISAAVLRAAGDVRHFEVVFVGVGDTQLIQTVASLYSSKTGVWGDLTTAQVPPGDSSRFLPSRVYPGLPAVMVGDCLYWLVWFIAGISFGILEFDLRRRCLALIPIPGEETIVGGMDLCDMLIVMAQGGGLGFLLLTRFKAQLWKRKTNGDGVDSWVLGRSIQLDKLLSLNPETERRRSVILGFAENNNVVLLWTSTGIFTVQLESLQFKKIFESNDSYIYFPFEGVYTTEKGIHGGQDGAELLQNT